MNESLEQRLLEHIGRPGYQPIKPRAIARQLDLSDDEYRRLRMTIKRLVKAGKIIYGSKHLVQPAAGGETEASPAESPKRSAPGKPKGNQMAGTFFRGSKGSGLVRLEAMMARGDKTADIYIPMPATGDAASGDKVLIELSGRRGPKGRPTGQVVEVLHRKTYRFVGTYFESAGQSMVQIDGTNFAEPILLSDPGVKNAKPDDKVIVEMVRFPSAWRDGEAVVIEVLGPRGVPEVDTKTILLEYNLPSTYPDDAVEEARRRVDTFDDRKVPKGREDLTALTTITIDPEDARDFDDAVSLETMDNGNWRLGVHIADVSYFVRPGTPLDAEARNRATSVYLPDLVIPMLPEAISNNLASLQPDKLRFTKSVFIEFDPEGMPLHAELCSGAIRSARRFNYDEVDEFLADPDAWKPKLTAPVHQLLTDMHRLAMTLRRRRLDRGAIELTMPEVKIDLDDEGRVAGAHCTENTESHQMIEEFMLAANEAVAQWLADRDIPFIRRIHQSPDPYKLQMLTEFVNELGVECTNLQNRFEIKRILEATAETPLRHAIHFAVLRSFQRAIYSPADEGHYALASSCYCHFTSPIRRYPDLTVHRLIEAVLAGKRPALHGDQLEMLAQHCSDREQRATDAERELVKLKLLNYLSGRLGTEMEVVITGVEPFGLFAQGLELPAEGLIHIDSLADDYYDFDRATHSLNGRRAGNQFRIGDLLQVEVVRADPDRRELDFRLRKVLAHPEDLLARSKKAKARRGEQRRESRKEERGRNGRKSGGKNGKKRRKR